MQNNKLLPCPFCGGNARISCDTEATRDSSGRLWAFTVVCDSCCATSGLCYSSEMATKSWNTRKPMKRIVEWLQSQYRKVTSDEDLEWNRAIDRCANVVRKGGVEDAE